ncbi:MAG: PIN domain-containing protein [Acidobacteriota bacterium]
MRQRVLCDTGPLVALLNRRDQYHNWAKHQFSDIEPPFFTCEPVLAEACFVLKRGGLQCDSVLRLVRQGDLKIPFRLEDEIDRIEQMVIRYSNVPMDLADACMVRLAEQISGSLVLTLDSDFIIYRMHDRRTIPTVMPTAP